jgi:predicted MFS family arabinose efflux permease
LQKNENTSNPNETKVHYGRLFLPSLVASNFASGPITVIAALLLIDIGATFNTSVGVTGQINTSYSIAAFTFALFMGALNIRFKHKSLLLTGLALIAISALGCFLASNLVILMAFYSISGMGFAMVSPMTMALVGEHLPLEKRANAVGWVVAGGALVYVIGAPIIAFMSGLGSWRLPLLEFIIPVLLISLFLAFIGLPSASVKYQTTTDRTAYLQSFKEILLNRSAVACLIGDILRAAAFIAILLYSISFIREQFQVSTDLASIVLLSAALCYALGSLACGSLINRFGRKSSAVITALLSGIFTVSFVFAPILWLSVLLIFVAAWFFGMVASAANCLTLEQVPKFKGTMMSIDSAVVNLGSALGAAVGGLAILSFNYTGMGSTLGIIGIAAAIIYLALAKDPTQTAKL